MKRRLNLTLPIRYRHIPILLSFCFLSFYTNLMTAMDIDLELNLEAQNPTVQIYESSVFTLTITNNGAVTATAINIDLPINPSDAVPVGGSEVIVSKGIYEVYGGQIWEVPSLEPGESATLSVEVFFLTEPLLYAQVLSVNEFDIDSSPGNGACCITLEDDEAVFPTNNEVNGCSFFVNHSVLEFGDPEFDNASVDIMEDANRFNITYNQGKSASLDFALDAEGNLLERAVNEFSTNTYNVSYSGLSNAFEFEASDSEGNLLWTRSIPVDYSDPASVVPGTVFETEDKLVFGGFLVDTSDGVTFSAYVVQTDLNGENALFTLINDLDDTFGLSEVMEDDLGNIYQRWITPGNISLSKVDEFGNLVWVTQVGADTPSITWDELDISADNQYVYAVLTDNLRAVVKKINNEDGAIENTFDLGGMFSPDDNFTINRTTRVLPLADGGFIGSSYFSVITGSNSPINGFEFGRISPEGNLLWTNSIEDFSAVNMGPELATLDGGFLFISANPSASINVLKVNAIGDLEPDCENEVMEGEVDLELSLSSEASNYAIYTNVVVTTTITNHGTETADNISVSIPQPVGTVSTNFTSSQGSFSLFFTNWDVGSLAPGASATFDWNLFMLNNSSFTTYAQVQTASPNDIDSTPGNGTCCTPNEDDEAALTLSSNVVGGENPVALSNMASHYDELILFPNPASDVLQLKYESTVEVFEVRILNQLGQIVGRYKFDQSNKLYDLNISHLKPGIYFANILDGKLIKTQRFVIE